MNFSVKQREQLQRDGYISFPQLVSAEQAGRMRQRLEALISQTPQSHAGTLIVGGLIEEEIFDSAWNHPCVLEAVESVLGPSHLLLGVSSRGLNPGHGQQALHSDWGGQGVPGVWYLCHVICALVDFTASNGATRVVPGTHHNPNAMRSLRNAKGPHPREERLLGKAGTVFVLNVHCLHSAVANQSSLPRHAIFSSFTRRDSPLLVQNPQLPPSTDTLARLTTVRYILE